MPYLTTPAELRPYVADHPEAVREVLERIQKGESLVVTFDVILDTSDLDNLPIEHVLAEQLNQDGNAGKFLALIRDFVDKDANSSGIITAVYGRNEIDENDPELGHYRGGAAPPANFDPDKLARFASASKRFRCRIFIDDRYAGTGAFISPHLVLTAWHVVGVRPGSEANGTRQIEVRAEGDDPHLARLVLEKPCDDREWEEVVEDHAVLQQHQDVALLRVSQPLGKILGSIRLPDKPIVLEGWTRLLLLHFPMGQDLGISDVEAVSPTPGAPRVLHTGPTDEGSSGGPGFDCKFNFVGIHQGRLCAKRRMVPYSTFAKDPEFRRLLRNDRAPDYLWSLDGTLDSHLIIGRRLFFETMSSALQGRAPKLRGFWIRRLYPEEDSIGLGFSLEILQRYLEVYSAPSPTICQFDLGPDVGDLYEYVWGEIFGKKIVEVGRAPGVGVKETTADGAQRDLARQFLRAIVTEKQATAEKPLWFYFANPQVLTSDVRVQFEHLLNALLAEPGTRFLIAGSETLPIPGRGYSNLAGVEAAREPCILLERVGEFEEADVTHTVSQICADLNLDWADDRIKHIVERALNGLQPHGMVYRSTYLAHVAEVLRDQIRPFVDGR